MTQAGMTGLVLTIGDVSGVIAGLTDEQWGTPSSADGWSVQLDVPRRLVFGGRIELAVALLHPVQDIRPWVRRSEESVGVDDAPGRHLGRDLHDRSDAIPPRCELPLHEELWRKAGHPSIPVQSRRIAQHAKAPDQRSPSRELRGGVC